MGRLPRFVSERGSSGFRLDWTATSRALVRRPAYPLAAILTVALGIGSTTAVFSVVDALLLAPLPFREPERLVAVWPGRTLANQEIDFLRRESRSYRDVAGWSPGWLMTLVGVDVPRQLSAARVGGNAFDLLGARAAIGRTFGLDAETPGNDLVAVLSDQLWREAFGADSAIVGRSIALDNQRYLVVGVMPPGFHLIDATSDLWTPLTMDPAAMTWAGSTALGLARLAPGVTVAGASAELATLAARMRERFQHPEDWSRGAAVVDLRESLVGGVRSVLWLLLAAVGFLLLIATTNVANLLLVRAVERRTELAVRAALGASRGRIVRLLGIESLIIALVGGAIGVGVAVLGVRGLVTVLPRDLPRVSEVGLNGRVLLAALVVTALTAVGVGLAPALHGAGLGAGVGSRAAELTRSALVSLEVALALVLLAGAALMGRTMVALSHVDPGFDPDRLLTAKVQPSGLSSDGLKAFWREALNRVERIPGVVSAATILHLPMSGRSWKADVDVEGRPLPAGVARPRTGWQSVSASYFATARVPLIEGRALSGQDRATGPRVVVVNAAFARRIFPGEAVVGRRITAGNATEREVATIVGVVGGVRHDSLNAEPEPELYVPFEQRHVWATSLLVRTAGDPAPVAELVRARIQSLDPNVPVTEVRSMQSVLSASLARPRMLLSLIGAFATFGILLGAIGIYGVVSFGVRQRRRELAIRAALGADRGALVRLVVGRGMRSTIWGLGFGLVAAGGLSTLVGGFVYGIGAADPLSFGAVTVFVFLVALVASWMPARRAAHAAPTAALKD